MPLQYINTPFYTTTFEHVPETCHESKATSHHLGWMLRDVQAMDGHGHVPSIWNSQRCGQMWFRSGPFHVGMSENGVYPQWNSHLVGIMISKTIGCRGTLFSDNSISVQHFFMAFSRGAKAKTSQRCSKSASRTRLPPHRMPPWTQLQHSLVSVILTGECPTITIHS